jgi:hypothetical protein
MPPPPAMQNNGWFNEWVTRTKAAFVVQLKKSVLIVVISIVILTFN